MTEPRRGRPSLPPEEKRKLTSFKLAPEVIRRLQELSEAEDCSMASIIEALVLGERWDGRGVWEGWNLTTDNAASSYGQPVMLAPDGRVLGPGDI